MAISTNPRATTTNTNAAALLAAAQGKTTAANPIVPTATTPITAAPTPNNGVVPGAAPVTSSNFNAAAYLAANPDVAKDKKWGADPYAHYMKYGIKEGRSLGAAETPIDPTALPKNLANAAQAVTGAIPNPQELINAANGTALSGNAAVGNIDENAAGTNIDKNNPAYAQANGPNATAAAPINAATGTAATGGTAATYTTSTAADKIVKANVTAAQGTVNQNAIIDAADGQIDIQSIATGKNPDGSVNATGAAMNQAAQQNIVNVIDTSTMAGKILAEKLGEGNYTDSKATLKGQLDVLSAEFANPDGSAKIPVWAQGAARGVSKIASFSGMTGTAATAAMATAIMEASIPVAQADAAFFQTLTIKNLDNRQEQTINKANILSKMEMQNADARTTVAIENSKNFMQMDLANLANEQQARVINSQNRAQAILEDAKAKNTQRLFTAQSQNEMDMFYDNLGSSMSQFNASQTNGMAQFNTSEANATSQFNAQLENNRQEFYKNMQYNIDVANAKWRQTVTLTENDQKFQAAAADVANMVGLTKEQMTQLWDRSDALLDYVWKSSESEKERANNLLISQNQIRAQTAMNSANNKAQGSRDLMSGIGSVIGSIAGAQAASGKSILGIFG